MSKIKIKEFLKSQIEDDYRILLNIDIKEGGKVARRIDDMFDEVFYKKRKKRTE